MELQLVLPDVSVEHDGLTLIQLLDVLNSTEQRPVAFFDETLTAYVILCVSETVPSNTTQLRVRMSLVSAGADTHLGNPRDITVTEQSLLTTGSTDDDTHYLIWKIELPVFSPTKAVPQQRLVVNALVDLSLDHVVNTLTNNETLEDLRPVSEGNLLEGLSCTFTTTKLKQSPVIPESVLVPSKANTNATQTTETRLVTREVTLPVYPVLQMKLKYTRLVGKSKLLLATLELGVSKYFYKNKIPVEVDEIAFSLPDGNVIPQMPSSLQFPLRFRDSTLNLTYKLTSDDMNSMVMPALITVESKIITEQTRKISTRWSTKVDFGISYLPPAPSSSSVTINGSPTASRTSVVPSRRNQELKKSLRQSSSSVVLPKQPLKPQNSLSGLKLSFSGTTLAKVGEKFKWKVQAVNNSESTITCSLFMQSSVQHSFEKSMPPIPVHINPGLNDKRDAVPVYPVPALIKAYNTAKLSSRGIICLSNNLKFGPIEPHSVFEADIELMAIEQGQFNLQGVRLVDLATGETFDCGGLLDVLVS